MDIGTTCQKCKTITFVSTKCNTCDKLFCKKCMHYDRNCDNYNEQSGIKNHYTKYNFCTYKSCKKNDRLFELNTCKYCKEKFCDRHRHEIDHKCSQTRSQIF